MVALGGRVIGNDLSPQVNKLMLNKKELVRLILARDNEGLYEQQKLSWKDWAIVVAIGAVLLISGINWVL